MYDFEFTDFALSDKGVHLLRNRFNYKTISFHELDKAVVKKGVETKNIFIMLIIGILFIALAIFLSAVAFKNFNDPKVHSIYIESFVLPVLPALLGFYCIYISLKKGPILLAHYGRENYLLSLKDAIKEGRIKDLNIYLKEKLRTKFIIQDEV